LFPPDEVQDINSPRKSNKVGGRGLIYGIKRKNYSVAKATESQERIKREDRQNGKNEKTKMIEPDFTQGLLTAPGGRGGETAETTVNTYEETPGGGQWDNWEGGKNQKTTM